MTNLALGKLPIEKWHTPEEATNGNYSEYKANSGYSKAHWPCYYTIDLEDECSIDTIRFLLYDKDDRNHQYRLLTSSDTKSWMFIMIPIKMD